MTEKTRMKHDFLSVFETPLKELGFKRKNLFFMRINGNILQTVTLDIRSHHFILRVAQLPYWCFRFCNRGFPFHSPHWACGKEINVVTKKQVAVDGVTYEVYDSPEIDVQLFEKYYQAFTEHYLPILQRTKDEDSFLSELITLEPLGNVSPYILLYLAYRNGSWEMTDQWLLSQYQAKLCDIKTNAVRNWEKEQEKIASFPPEIVEMMQLTPSHETAEQYMQRYIADTEELYQKRYSVYIEKRQTNDINWIKPLYDECCSEVRRDLFECFRLDVCPK